jgi:hypothetical protein
MKSLMVWWRIKGKHVWHFGYMTDIGNGLVRMGPWLGSVDRGPVVSRDEIETREYKSR